MVVEYRFDYIVISLISILLYEIIKDFLRKNGMK
jgi:hypothetical protein